MQVLTAPVEVVVGGRSMSSPAIHQTVDLVKDEQTKFMRLLQVCIGVITRNADVWLMFSRSTVSCVLGVDACVFATFRVMIHCFFKIV